MPELFVMPVPLMRKVAKAEAEVMVKALAPALNTMPLRVTLEERETPVLLETLKEAVSESPFGTVAGVQLVAAFQLVVAGSSFHVALPAKVLLALQGNRMLTAAIRKSLSDVFTGHVIYQGRFPKRARKSDGAVTFEPDHRLCRGARSHHPKTKFVRSGWNCADVSWKKETFIRVGWRVEQGRA